LYKILNLLGDLVEDPKRGIETIEDYLSVARCTNEINHHLRVE